MKARFKRSLLVDSETFGTRNEFACRSFEGVGDFEDVGEGDVPLPALNLSHVREVEPGSLTQTLLAPLEFLPSIPHFVSEGNVGRTERTHSSEACTSSRRVSRDYKYQFWKTTWRIS